MHSSDSYGRGKPIVCRRVLCGLGCALILAAPLLAQEEGSDEGFDPQVSLEVMRKQAGTRIVVRVLNVVEATRIPGIRNFVGDKSKVAIVEANEVRAILVPGSTVIQAGMTLPLNVQFIEKVVTSSKIGLPNPVAIYREAGYKDQVLYRYAYADALEAEIAKFRRPGSLTRFLIPWERVKDLTPEMASRGLPNPMSAETGCFFTRLPDMRFQVVESIYVDGNYEVRMINSESGAKAILCLPWNSTESLRGAARGTIIEVGGWVEAIIVGPSGIERGRYFLKETDYPEYLFGKVRTI